MEKTSRSPLATCHVVLMGLLMAMHLIFIVMIVLAISAAKGLGEPLPAAMWGFLGVSVLDLLSLACGIKYALSGYRKQAAVYYKGFMLLMALSYACSALTSIVTTGFNASVALILVKVLILLSLTFLSDLGENNTWIFFFVLVLVDFAATLLFGGIDRGLGTIVGTLCTRLLIDATVVLAIRGKYANKYARGSE